MKKLKLVCEPLLNGIMAYWEKEEDAVRYIIKLYINNDEISTRFNERSELFYTFNGLAAIDGKTSSIFSEIVSSPVVAVGESGFYSKNNGSGLNYYIRVQAEDRAGNIIAESSKVECRVKEL